jgi:hypothetical protein
VSEGKKKDSGGQRGLQSEAIASCTYWSCEGAIHPKERRAAAPLDALIIQSWHKERLRGIIRKFEK